MEQEAEPVVASDDPSDPAHDGSPGVATEAKPHRTVPVWVVAVLGAVIVGAGVVAVLAMTGAFSRGGDPVAAEDDLVAAYQHSREVAYTLEGEFSRTKPDGARLESALLVVQQPPNSLRRQLGGISGRVNGHQVNCNTDPSGRFQCAEGAPVGPWEAMVDDELANLRSYFDPARPVYQATEQSDGCFELKLLVSMPDPPYGVRTVMCFDPTWGALRSLELEHDGGVVDRIEASSIRAVAPQDFSLDADGHFAAQTDPGGG